MRKQRTNPLAEKTQNMAEKMTKKQTDQIEELDFWNPIEDVEEETAALNAVESDLDSMEKISLFSNEDLSEEIPYNEFDDIEDDPSFDDDSILLWGTKRSKFHPGILIVSALIVIVLAVGGVYLFVSNQANSAEEQAAIALQEEEALRKQQQEAKARYDEIMSGKTFLKGVTVEGIDIGGMTRKEAESALEPMIKSIIPSGKLPLNFQGQSYEFDLSLIQATGNLDTVLKDAMNLAVSDDMETTLAKADEIAANGHNFTLTLQHNFDSVTKFVSELATEVNIPMKNAAIGTVDTVNHTVTMTEAVAGVSIKENDLVTLINNAILTGTLTPIDVPVDTVEPTVKDSDLRMIEIGAETSFKGSSSSRIYNIKKGADLINGKVLSPGDIFSTNDVLGVRTYKNGWKEANAYVGGTTEVQAGGGVCQLSSTLYNAVVKADLEVVSRRNHSMPVSYIKNGLDATINSVGNIIDFKFKNNTDCDLVVFAWTEGKDVCFKIIRCAFESNEYDEIRLTAEKISTVYPDGEMEVIIDPMLAPGVEEIDVATQNGSIYQSYKNYYKNGELIRTEKLAKSTYKAFNGSKRVGPMPSPSPSLSPSPSPTQPPITIITPVPENTATPVPATPTPIPTTPTPVPETPTQAPITPVPETPTPEPETPTTDVPEPTQASTDVPVITQAPEATEEATLG